MDWLDKEPRAEEILDFWEAYDLIEPVRISDSELLCQIGSEISHVAVFTARANGVAVKTKQAVDFLPRENVLRKKEKPKTGRKQRTKDIHRNVLKTLESRGLA